MDYRQAGWSGRLGLPPPPPPPPARAPRDAGCRLPGVQSDLGRWRFVNSVSLAVMVMAQTTVTARRCPAPYTAKRTHDLIVHAGWWMRASRSTPPLALPIIFSMRVVVLSSEHRVSGYTPSLDIQVLNIINFRGSLFFVWPALFRPPGSVWRPLFRRREAAPRQNFACAAGKWDHLAQLCEHAIVSWNLTP